MEKSFSDVGVISAQKAIQFGFSGPMLRGSVLLGILEKCFLMIVTFL